MTRTRLITVLALLGALVAVAPPARAATAITPGQQFTIDVPAGTTADYTFAGAAGQRVSLALPVTPAGARDTVGLLDPEGHDFRDAHLVSDGFGYLEALTTSGSWTLRVAAEGSAIQGPATLYAAAATTAPLPLGKRATAGLTEIGAHARYTWHQVADEHFSLVADADVPAGAKVIISMQPVPYVDDGTDQGIRRAVWETPTHAHLVQIPPVTGTWSIDIAIDAAATGSVTFTATHPKNAVLPVTLGKQATVTYPGDGSGVLVRFGARKGQRLDVDVLRTALTTRDQDAEVEAAMIRPDGLWDTRFDIGPMTDPGWYDTHLQLTQTGTWSLLLSPAQTTAGKQSVVLRLTTDVVKTLVPGKGLTLTTTRPGQVARTTIPVPAGRTLVVRAGPTHLRDDAGEPVTTLVLRSPGRDPVTAAVRNGKASFARVVVARASTWTIELDPVGRTVGTVTITARRRNT